MDMLSLHDTWFGASLTLEIAAQFTVLFMVALTIEAIERNAQPIIPYALSEVRIAPSSSHRGAFD